MLKKLLKTSIFILSGFGIFFSVQGARLEFLPSEGNFIQNCPFEVDIFLDTEGYSSNTTDLQFFQNDNFEILDVKFSKGVFPQYTKLKTNTARHNSVKGQKTRYFMGTTGGPTGFIGSGKIATLTILPKNNTEKIDLKRYLIPNYNGDDSNTIVLSGNTVYDILEKGTDGQYSLTSGKCEIPIAKNSEIFEKSLLSIENISESDLFIHNEESLRTTDSRYQKEISNIGRNLQITKDEVVKKPNGFKNKIRTLWEKIVELVQKTF